MWVGELVHEKVQEFEDIVGEVEDDCGFSQNGECICSLRSPKGAWVDGKLVDSERVVGTGWEMCCLQT